MFRVDVFRGIGVRFRNWLVGVFLVGFIVELLKGIRDVLYNVLVNYLQDKFGLGEVESRDIARVIMVRLFSGLEVMLLERYGIDVDLDMDGV